MMKWSACNDEAGAQEIELGTAELNDRLRAGDVWGEGSRSYQAIDSLLIPRAALVDLDAQGAASPGPIEVDAWIGAHQQLLD